MRAINSVILKRLYFIDNKFRKSRFVKTSMLADEYQVSEKTIYRDIEFLKSEFDAPIQYDIKEKSFYYTKPFKLSVFDFTVNELYNLAVIRELIKSFRSNPYATGQKTLFKKLAMSFGDEINGQIQNVKEKISFKFKPERKIDDKIFSILEKALFEEITVSIDYFSIDKNITGQRKIDPYHLRNYEGNWYLIGYNHDLKKVRVMAVNRIKKIKLTNQYFDVPETFNIRDYFKDSTGNRRSSKLYYVILEVKSVFVNQILETKIHPSQKIKQLENGNTQITLIVNELTEIKNLVLANAANVRIINPPELIELALKDSKTILKNHT